MSFRIVILILFLGLISSCSPVKKYNRLLKKHPFLEDTTTVIKHDTIKVFTEKIRIDTAFITKKIDTIFFEKENVKVKIVRFYDTINVFIDKPADTIFVPTESEIKYIRPKAVEDKKRVKTITLLFILIILMAILIFRK